MLPDRVSNPGPLTYESGALPIALRDSAIRDKEFVPKEQNSTLAEQFPMYMEDKKKIWAFLWLKMYPIYLKKKQQKKKNRSIQNMLCSVSFSGHSFSVFEHITLIIQQTASSANGAPDKIG